MTTILADFRLGVIVSDSSISDDDRVWTGKKVFRHQGALFAFAGQVSEHVAFMVWLKQGQQGKPPTFSHSCALMMNENGLFMYDDSHVLLPVRTGIEAIGTGDKAAMCAYEALGWSDPVKAVRIVCKHDNASRPPVKTYRIKR